jgi:hypothetical protein
LCGRHDLSLQVTTDAQTEPPKASLRVKIADKLLTTLFKVRPIFKAASNKARSMMMDRVKDIYFFIFSIKY